MRTISRTRVMVRAAAFCFACAATVSTLAVPATLSLKGQWRLQLDRANIGIQERWFDRSLSDKIQLPGSLPAQGIGDAISVDTRWTGDIVDKTWFTDPRYAPYREPGNVKIPFWLQPETYYAGVAWYQRDIQIPAGWAGKRVVLTLERPHWETRLWVDDEEIGSNRGLSTPHEYDLGTGLAPGKHRITIRVDNSVVVDVGVNSHCITDHTQGNWNGIVGDIRLRATAPVHLDDLQIYPDWKANQLRIKGSVGAPAGESGKGTLELGVFDKRLRQARIPRHKSDVAWTAGHGTFEVTVPFPDGLMTWDEFSPRLYEVVAWLNGGDDKRTVVTGFRHLTTRGTQFVLNDRKLFIRGTLECCIFPKTGHPPTDVDSWKRIIRIARAHGLNLLRFHSYCPPEAAFIAGDELGFYFQVETCWANQSTTIGDGKPVDQWVYDETDRILKAYGNHPSFLLMPYGNEPGGKNSNDYLAKYVEHFKTVDPRRLWTAGSGWPQLPVNDFHVTPDPRIQGWGEGLKSRINALPPETTTDYRDYIQKRQAPVISHEIGQWCVYPNFDEIPKYTGYLKAKNFEIFRDSLRAHRMGNLAHKFLIASGKLQALCYKEDIESALRTPGMGGFELLDLHDFPGQGTALVGVLDPFWDEKGYITAAQYSRFCNSTVPLARLAKRVFTTDDTLHAAIEVAHFGPDPLENAVAHWKLLSDAGKVLAEGSLPARSIPVDNGIALGEINVDLKAVPAPARCKLVVGLANTRFENDWDIWVYPPRVETAIPEGVLLVDELNDQALSALNVGGKVLLNIPPARVKGDKQGKVALGFSSIFWNTAWTGRQPPHTLGILCNPRHPALASFPTEDHSNWQWWYLVSRAGAMILDDLPAGLQPTVQVIDDWVTNRKLGLLFEARVGSGKLLVTSIDLQHNLQDNPVARQLLHSLCAYMAGNRFKPAAEVTPAQVRSLETEPSPLQRAGARVMGTDSAQRGYEGENVLDGDPATLWHTSWDGNPPGFPHHIDLAFDRPATLRGITVLPRQDDNRNGWVKDYAVYLSADGQHWGEPVAKGTFSPDKSLKQIPFPQPVEVRFLRIVALSGYANGPWACFAEISVLP